MLENNIARARKFSGNCEWAQDWINYMLMVHTFKFDKIMQYIQCRATFTQTCQQFVN